MTAQESSHEVEESSRDIGESSHDVGAFLSVLAALLLDNALRLEEIAGGVTERVMSAGRPDREMIVMLQSFDRLKQEFEALGDALARYAESTNALPSSGEERTDLGHRIIAKITLADLKDRLLSRLQDGLPAVSAPPLSAEVAAQVGVDVEF